MQRKRTLDAAFEKDKPESSTSKRLKTDTPPVVKFDMDGRITPPIQFSECKTLPAPQALYIEAFNEIFTELKEKERQTLLTQINNFCKKEKLIIFIDTGYTPLAKCRKKTEKVLGKNSHLDNILQLQEKNNTKFSQFKMECESKKCETVYIGGVFGRFCVWGVAKELGKNVYAKQFGEEHPNIRFTDKDFGFQFQNVVICPELTEGYLSDEFTLPHFIVFPDVITHQVSMGAPGLIEKEQARIQKEKKDALGESYKTNFSELKQLKHYKALFEFVKKLLIDSVKVSEFSLFETKPLDAKPQTEAKINNPASVLKS